MHFVPLIIRLCQNEMLIKITNFNVSEAFINQVRRTSEIMHYAFYIMH